MYIYTSIYIYICLHAWAHVHIMGRARAHVPHRPLGIQTGWALLSPLYCRFYATKCPMLCRLTPMVAQGTTLAFFKLSSKLLGKSI